MPNAWLLLIRNLGVDFNQSFIFPVQENAFEILTAKWWSFSLDPNALKLGKSRQDLPDPLQNSITLPIVARLMG